MQRPCFASSSSEVEVGEVLVVAIFVFLYRAVHNVLQRHMHEVIFCPIVPLHLLAGDVCPGASTAAKDPRSSVSHIQLSLKGHLVLMTSAQSLGELFVNQRRQMSFNSSDMTKISHMKLSEIKKKNPPDLTLNQHTADTSLSL